MLGIDPDCLAWGKVRLPDFADRAGYHFHPALLDGCLQVTLTALQDQANNGWIPVGVKEYRFHQTPQSPAVYAIIRKIHRPSDDMFLVDIAILDEAAALVAEVAGLTLKQTAYRMENLLNLQQRSSDPLVQQVREASSEELPRALAAYVKSRLANILDLSLNELEVTQPLIDLGMDSLMAIELRNDIQTDLRLELSMEELLDVLTPNDLTARLLHQMESPPAQDPADDAADEWIEGAI